MRRTHRLALFLLLLLAIGCAPGGVLLPPVLPGADGGRAVADLLARQPCPTDLASDLKMSLQTQTHRSVEMAGGMRAVWPDRLRIQARVGAFWPVASIAVDGDSAFVSIPRLKGYWSGVPARWSGGDPAALAASLLWLLCPSRLAGTLINPTLDQAPEGWILRGLLPGGEAPLPVEVHLPRDRAEVRAIVFRDREGRVLLRAERLGQESVALGGIAETIRLESGEPFVRFEVRFLRPRPDPDPPPEIFRIPRPPGADWIAEERLLEMLTEATAPR